jgi:hypothetical protein
MNSSDEHFDPELIEVMRQALEEAWAGLSPEQQTQTNKSAMASRILHSAGKGERDVVRLRTRPLLTT